ncbi:MAG: hypothetical protein E6538_14980 [Paeniclostridium sordellii]|nr:hypothetical protein [Paeniclostridium sordellii]
MKETLRLIDQAENLDSSNLEDLYFKLRNVLNNSKDEGINYSDIAEFVFDMKQIDTEYLTNNLNKIREYASSKNDRLVKDGISKIKNHVKLEVCRIEFLEKKQKKELEEISKDTFDKFQPLNDRIGDYENIAKKHEATMRKHENTMRDHRKEISNWNANIVTILGLFSAIVVTFFGGLAAINSIFNKIDSVSMYRLTFVILIVIFAMFNIVFMLLYYIGIITGKNLNRECSNTCTEFEPITKNLNCNGDGEIITSCSKKNPMCYFKRYPVIVYFNIAIILMMFGILVIHAINK